MNNSHNLIGNGYEKSSCFKKRGKGVERVRNMCRKEKLGSGLFWSVVSGPMDGRVITGSVPVKDT